MPNFPQIGRFFTELGIYTSVSRQLGNILGENDDFFKGAQAGGRTWDLMVFVYFLSL